MKICLVILIVMLALKAGAEPARLDDEALRNIRFEQKPGEQVSLALPFLDEQGRITEFGRCVNGKPAIVVMGYYGCPMLCTLVLNGLISSLQDLKPSVGETFSVIFVSVDPAEQPSLAAEKKNNYVRLYGRATSAGGWHFLTGSQESIAKLAGEIGFQFAYDPASKQFAHPSGIVILTPRGKVSRYFFGINFPPGPLDEALKTAGREEAGSPARQFFYLCFHYNPVSGHGKLVLLLVRLAGVATLVGLAGLIAMGHRQERRRRL